MSDTTDNGSAATLLQRAEAKLESGLGPETRQNYDKIVLAGMHAGLTGGPNSILASLEKSPDPIKDAAQGAVSLVLVLRKEAKGVMPLKAAVPAAMTLMLKALAFADRAGIVKVGEPELVKATHIFTDFLFARFGITKQGLADAAQKVHALTQDPQAMQAIKSKAGMTAPPPPAPAGQGLINGALPPR